LCRSSKGMAFVESDLLFLTVHQRPVETVFQLMNKTFHLFFVCHDMASKPVA
jgi:hypothetical protein